MTHMMHPTPEVLYRNDEHRFSVYRLADLPEGVRCSGWADPDPGNCRHFDSVMTSLGRRYFCQFSRLGLLQAPRDAVVAVLDEYAGPLLKPRPPLREFMISADLAGGPDATVVVVRHLSKKPSFSIDVEQMHREQTHNLGAWLGEFRHNYSKDPRADIGRRSDARPWSAHLRFLVQRSEAERRRRELDIGWDPYGDDL